MRTSTPDEVVRHAGFCETLKNFLAQNDLDFSTRQDKVVVRPDAVRVPFFSQEMLKVVGSYVPHSVASRKLTREKRRQTTYKPTLLQPILQVALATVLGGGTPSGNKNN